MWHGGGDVRVTSTSDSCCIALASGGDVVAARGVAGLRRIRTIRGRDDRQLGGVHLGWRGAGDRPRAPRRAVRRAARRPARRSTGRCCSSTPTAARRSARSSTRGRRRSSRTARGTTTTSCPATSATCSSTATTNRGSAWWTSATRRNVRSTAADRGAAGPRRSAGRPAGLSGADRIAPANSCDASDR